jgi:hypothetical protein
MHDLAGVELSADAFVALEALCRADPRFPKDRSSWNALVAQANAAAQQRGQPVKTVHVDPTRFQRWCTAVDVPTCLDSLRAYCIVHKVPRGTQHYGETSLDSDVVPFNPSNRTG